MIATSAGSRSITAARICSAVSTSTRSTLAGSGRRTVATSVTLAPRTAASVASAYPCLPDERLPTNRTGSMGSRVPPAVTRTRSPVRSPLADGAACRQGVRRGRKDRLGGRQTARSLVTAGEAPLLRLHHRHAPLGEQPQVVPGGRVFPHLGVHRRADHDRCPGRQQGGAQQVVGQPRGVGSDHPGGGRTDQDQIGLPAEGDVRDRIGVVEQREPGSFGGECRERDLADEAPRRIRQHRDDVGAGVDEPAADLDRLVGGDPAADGEDDAATRERCHGRLPAGAPGIR